MRTSPWISVVVLAVAVRLGLYSVAGLSESIGSRVEVSSPISAFKRLTESMFLVDQGHSPYQGDAFHQPPLLMLLFYPLRHATPWATRLVFVLSDLIVAFALRAICLYYGRKTDIRVPSAVPMVHTGPGEPSVKPGPMYVTVETVAFPILAKLPEVVACSYLLNPFTVATCVGQSTACFVHLALALAVLCAARGFAFAMCAWLAVAAYLDVYPVLLLVPLTLLVHDARNGRQSPRSGVWRTAIGVVVSFALCIGSFLWLSVLLIGDWSFAWKSYGTAFFVTDLTPGVGLFWYLFTEMFDRFRTFFLVIAHSHLAFYVAPLAIRFGHEPLFFSWALVAIPLVFKSYPVVGDMAFSVCLLLTQSSLVLPKMRRIYPLVWLLMLSTCLAFLMWFLWIYPGSGNANFFYFQTLIFVFCNAFLVIESIASVRRLSAAREAAALANML